jgi:glycosyltransferase involved in cell wall biosynthesis
MAVGVAQSLPEAEAVVEEAIETGDSGKAVTPLDIVFFSGGLPHDGATLAQRSLGGSETAAILVAKALAKRGHYVTVFSPCQGGIFDGVVYMPIDQFTPYAVTTPHDVTIISRIPEMMRARFASKVSVLWCHDLTLKRQRGALGSALWNTDAIYLLSKFMVDQYKSVHPQIPDSLYFQTRNGIELDRFVGLERLPRDRTKVMYGSRPERGLETCFLIMEELWRRKSPLRLYVSWYDNTPDQLRDYYQYLFNRAQQLPNVTLLGALKQQEWHKHLATARMLIYPGVNGEFNEISCLNAMEAQAVGTPVVTLRKGAMPETCPAQACTLLGGQEQDVTDPTYISDFATAMQQIYDHDALFKSMSIAGRVASTMRSWDDVAREWEADWYGRLDAQINDIYRVSQHCKREGEHDLTDEFWSWK